LIRVRVVTIIDDDLIKIIDVRLHGWSKNWSLLSRWARTVVPGERLKRLDRVKEIAEGRPFGDAVNVGHAFIEGYRSSSRYGSTRAPGPEKCRLLVSPRLTG
jgi:hypothetical protein